MMNSVRKMIPLFVVFTILFVLCLGMFQRSKVSANTYDLADVSRVESILIKKGDTLSSIAEQYAPEKSHITTEEYMEQIIRLNNLKSEQIKSGHYLVIPDYCSE